MDLKNKTVVVVGGTRGLGKGIVEAMAAKGARVLVVARTAGGAGSSRFGAIEYLTGDVTDAGLARRIVAERRPGVVVLVAGAIPPTSPIDAIDWDEFTRPWQSDTRGALAWSQACLACPMPPGGVVVSVSSGAALKGSPLSGGYAGAKRMQWLISNYAHSLAMERGLGLRFTAVLPLQMVPGTGVGDAAAQAYARRLEMDENSFFSRFGRPLTPRAFGDHVADILERAEDDVRAYGVKGDTGLTVVERDGD